MNPDRSVCVERGRKPFYEVLMAAERKCCDGTLLPQIAGMQMEYAGAYLR